MGYTTAGAIIRMGVQGAGEARRLIDSVGDSLNSLPESVRSSMTSLASSLAVGLSAGLMASFVKGAIDAADESGKLAQKIGIAVNEVAGLELAFQQSGIGANVMTASMSKLSKGIVDGNKTMERLGIKTVDVSGRLRGTKDVLGSLADRFAGMENGAMKTRLAVDLFGESGADLIPMLNAGSEGMREMDDMANKLGLTISKKTKDEAEKFNDTVDLLQMGMQGVARKIAADLLPTLSSLAGSFLESMTSGDRLARTAEVIGFGLKSLYSVAVVGVEVFATIGKTIGAAAGQVVAVLQGDFKMAAQIGREWSKDIGESWSNSAKALESAWSESGSAVVDAMRDAAKKSKELKQSADEVAKRQAAANKELAIQSTILAGLSGVTATYTEDLSRLQRMRANQVVTEQQYVALVTELIGKQPGAKKAMDEYTKSVETAAKAAKDNQKAIQAGIASSEKDIATIYDQVIAIEQKVKTYGMLPEAITAVHIAELEASKQSKVLTDDGIAAIERKIDALKELAGMQIASGAQDSVKKSEEAMLKNYESTVEKYGDIFRTGFADMLNNGKAGWKSFTTSLVTTFKTSVADQIYKMFAKPFVMKLVASLMGINGGGLVSGIAGAAGASGFASAGDGQGGLGSAMGMLQMGKSLYSGFSGAFTSGMGTIIGNLGTTFGSTAMASFGSGMTGVAAGFGPTVAGSATGLGAAGAYSTAGAAGSSMAAAIPIVGWIAAGMAVSNSLYKQGWDSTNGTISGLGKIVGSGTLMLDKINRALGMSAGLSNILSGQATFSRLFGRKNPEVEKFGIDGSFGAGGFSGRSFQEILEKGGVFRSDKRYTTGDKLDAGLESSFDDTIKNLIATVKDFGSVMGIEASQIDSYTKAIKLTLTKDDAKNQELITGIFGDIGNDLAAMLIPSIAGLSQAGESAAATLQRLATNYVGLDAILNSVGMSIGVVGTESLAAREMLVGLTGGLDALAQNTSSFAQNFLTEGQRLAPVQKHVTDELARMGMAGIKTRDHFRDAVLGLQEGGKLATEAGAATFAGMMALQSAFALVVPAQADAIQAMRSKVDSLLSGVEQAFSVLQRVIDAEKNKLADAHAVTIKALEKRIATETTAMAKHKSLADAIGSTLDQMRMPGNEAAERAAAQSQIKTALAIARAGGPLPTSDSLKSALSSLSKDTSDQFATMVDFQRDFYRTQNDLSELAGLTDQALSVDERTLATLEGQKNLTQLAYEGEVLRLDGILANAQTQIDIMRGQDVTLLTIAGALAGFNSSVLAAMKNPVVGATGAINSAYQTSLGRAPGAAGMQYWQDAAAGGMTPEQISKLIADSPEAKVQKLFKSVLGRTGDAAGVDYWTKQLTAGMSETTARDLFMKSTEYKKLKGIPGFVNGGNHTGGLRWVGENGPELENTRPSRIHSTRDLMASLRNPASNDAALAAQVERLLAKLDEQIEATERVTEQSKRSADVLNGQQPVPFLMEIA